MMQNDRVLLVLAGAIFVTAASPLPRPPVPRCAAASSVVLNYGEQEVTRLTAMLSPTSRKFSSPGMIANYEKRLADAQLPIVTARKVLGALPSKSYPAVAYTEFESTPGNKLNEFVGQCAAAYVK